MLKEAIRTQQSAVGLRGVLNIAEGLPGSIMWMVPGRVRSGFLNGGSKHHHLIVVIGDVNVEMSVDRRPNYTKMA